jgi:hypothetical protein
MIVGFMVMHYGCDYAGYAIKSVYDHVDVMLVAYSPEPSHGHSSSLTNPESKGDCRKAVFSFGDPQNKIRWTEGTYSSEGKHRDVVWNMYPKADLVAVVDADEVWHSDRFATIRDWVLKSPGRNFKQALRTPWRSFTWVCDDPMMPDRWYKPGKGGDAYVPQEFGPFYHMGYARKPEYIKYKLSCHGHKCEMRGNWFQDKFIKWETDKTLTDVHPTCENMWTPKKFDREELPPILRQHPYWNLGLIK